MKRLLLASALVLAALLTFVPQACVPISSSVAVQIPGTYNVTFAPLQVELGGVVMEQKSNGLYVNTAGSLTVNTSASGCLTDGKPPEKTICLCEQFKICPNTTDSVTAVMTLPNIDRSKNNKTVVYVTFAEGGEPLKIEGALDGRNLGLLLGLDAALKAGKVGKADCFSTKASVINGNGTMNQGEFTGTFKGEIAGLWSAGCKFGPVVLAAGLTLKRPYTATKTSSDTPIPDGLANSTDAGASDADKTPDNSTTNDSVKDAGKGPTD